MRTKRSSDGGTPAHSAARAGHGEALQALRELGCGMGDKDNAGATATQYLVRDGRVEALEVLRAAGPSGQGGASRSNPEQEEREGSCALCLEEDAWWVLEDCGHKCICKGCMRKKKEKAAKEEKAAGKKGPKGSNSKKKKGSGLVACPLCRAETRAVPAAGYTGRIYENC